MNKVILKSYTLDGVELNRDDLNKLTAKRLIEIIKKDNKSSKSKSSLSHLSKKDLVDMLLNVPAKDEVKDKGRISQKSTQKSNFAKKTGSILITLKKKRLKKEDIKDDDSPIFNELIFDTFIDTLDNVVVKVNANRANKETTFLINNMLLGFSGFFLIIDSILGWDKLPLLFKNWKEKRKIKKEKLKDKKDVKVSKQN